MTAVVEDVEVSTDHWIGGERVSSSATFEDRSPIDEGVLARVARGTADDADRAVEAARAGAEVWGATAPKRRAEILQGIADLVDQRVPELAAVETRDNGSLLRSMRTSVMPRVARNFRFFADQLGGLDEAFEMDGFRSRTEWDPSGVTVVITPWNAPLMLATWRVAPALAAGNAVVLKPPEWAPLTASLLADIAREAGLPDGAFNVLQGIGEEAGAALTRHPGVDRIAFTGSIETGKLVAQAAAANLTPVSLELGGKSPFVAFADADLDAVVKQAVNQFDNAGQVCLAGTRLILERSLREAFLERFLPAASAIRQGDPRLDETDLGPQITREHFERVDGFVRRAQGGRDGDPRRGTRTTSSAGCTTGRRCSSTSPRGPRSCAGRSSARSSRCRRSRTRRRRSRSRTRPSTASRRSCTPAIASAPSASPRGSCPGRCG